MNRREMLWTASAGAVAMMGGWRANAAALPLRDAAREAYIYSLPLIESARVRGAMARARASNGLGLNKLAHSRALATPQSRTVTSPNVDTLYSSAFVDLAGGPATLTLPPTGERYISFALMDMYTNNFAVLGTRTTGPDGGVFTIVGPTASAGSEAIRSPTPWIWAAARVLISGASDLDAAHAVQDGITLSAGQARTPGEFARRDAPWAEYFASVQRLLAENPPLATDMGLFHRVAALGLGPTDGFDPARFSADQAAQIAAGIQDALASLRAGRGATKPIDGWVYPPADVGDFGQDYALRAGVALGGLAALPPAEAMYFGAVSPAGTPMFNDDRLFRLTFPAGKTPPAKAFWSLTMYETAPEGQSYLTDNPLNRYAIGDRTQGLAKNPDGSCDIWIGRSDPGDARRSNWLPAPRQGPFRMSLRCYLPEPALVNGDYRLPPIVPA